MFKQRQARVNGWYFWLFFLIGVFFVLYQALASQPFVTTSGGLTVFNINEDVSVNLNVTINNTENGQVGNITQVNITVTNPGLASTPSGYNFTANTNGTSGRTAGTGAGNHTFLNTSGSTSVLSWTNTSYFVVNGSNGSFVEFFFFNVTFTTPGNYTLQVLSMNASGGVNQTNLTVQVNDTTFPTIALLNSTNGVFDNSSNFSVNAIFINVTITELNESNITFILFNTSTNVNTTTFTNTGNRSLNVTGLFDGNFTYNVTVVDLANNRNTTATRTVVLDTTLPTSLTFGNETQNVKNNASNVSANAIFFNFTFTEINARNVTFTLYNTSTNVNTTTFDGRGTVTLNVTGLFDGNFTYNITVTDIVNQRNSTETRNILLDSTFPVSVSFGNSTQGVFDNSSNISTNAIFFNFTFTEINVRNITFSLANATASVNVTTFAGRGTTTLNVTGLADGNYTLNVSVVDIANNRNTTATRTVVLDTTLPLISLGNTTHNVLINDTNISVNWIFINTTSITEINEKNITFSLSNSSGVVNVTTFTDRTRSLNITGLGDGNYTFNVTICDIAHNCNTTTIQSIRLDTNAPPAPSFSCTPSTVRVNDPITCTCAGAIDAVSGLNRSFGSNGFLFTTNPSTLFTGTFTESCTVRDMAGNQNSSTTTYVVNVALGGGAAGGGGGGGGAATGGDTYVVNTEQSKTGFTREVGANDGFKLTVSSDSSQHTVTVSEVRSDGKVKITVKSEPIEVILGIGETKKIDVNNDKIYDISVTLHSISSGKAKITVKTIQEPAPAQETGVVSEPITEKETEEATEVGERVKVSFSKTLMWIIGAVVLLVLVVIIVMKTRRHR